MHIKDSILELRQNITKEYDEYVHIIKKIEKELTTAIEENSSDSKAICIIAMVESELRKARTFH